MVRLYDAESEKYMHFEILKNTTSPIDKPLLIKSHDYAK